MKRANEQSSRQGRINIFIPTYNRLGYLKRLLNSVEFAMKVNSHRLPVRVFITNNDHSCVDSEEFTSLIERLIGLRKYNTNFMFKVKTNTTNIGGNRNVGKQYIMASHYCCEEYCWVIGDDDVINENAFNILMPIIESNFYEYIITNDQGPTNNCNNGSNFNQLIGEYSSYREIMIKSRELYPEFPIHHTLISANIFKGHNINTSEFYFHLQTRYAHMYALMSGLVQRKPCYIKVLPGLLSKSDSDPNGFRIEESTDRLVYLEIPLRWSEYFTWLRGINSLTPNAYDLRPALNSDRFPYKKYQIQ